MLAPIRLIAMCLLLTVSGVAPAQVVSWTLQNLGFTDGSSASGSFSWNASTNAVVDWNLALTDGSHSSFPAATFNSGNSTISYGNPPPSGFQDIIFRSTTVFFNDRGLDLRLGIGPLDNLDIPAPSLALISTDLSGPSGALICYNCSPYVFANAGGSVSAVAAIPEPEIYALLSVGLGLIGWVGRRKKLKKGVPA